MTAPSHPTVTGVSMAVAGAGTAVTAFADIGNGAATNAALLVTLLAAATTMGTSLLKAYFDGRRDSDRRDLVAAHERISDLETQNAEIRTELKEARRSREIILARVLKLTASDLARTEVEASAELLRSGPQKQIQVSPADAPGARPVGTEASRDAARGDRPAGAPQQPPAAQQ